VSEIHLVYGRLHESIIVQLSGPECGMQKKPESQPALTSALGATAQGRELVGGQSEPTRPRNHTCSLIQLINQCILVLCAVFTSPNRLSLLVT
jgi:hypothetical protein